jgi:hypothetical protein
MQLYQTARANHEYEETQKNAVWRDIFHRLLGRSNTLLAYDEVYQHRQCKGQHDIGTQTIPVENIRGSISRWQDYDRDFRPRKNMNAHRWQAIYKALQNDVALPAIAVYKIDDVFFVEDGHHRVSVAKAIGQLYIDAHTIEVTSGFIETPVIEAAQAPCQPLPTAPEGALA